LREREKKKNRFWPEIGSEVSNLLYGPDILGLPEPLYIIPAGATIDYGS